MSGGAGRIEMGLSPTTAGRAMVADSLSHFLSVVQEILPVDRTTRLVTAELSDRGADPESAELSVALEEPFPRAVGRLVLRRVATQPRPAWLSVDGRRMDRRVRLPEYEISFRTPEGREAPADDPLGVLVYGFASLLRELDFERIRAESHRIRERARLYGEILARL
jgi:hypothetical protein